MGLGKGREVVLGLGQLVLYIYIYHNPYKEYINK